MSESNWAGQQGAAAPAGTSIAQFKKQGMSDTQAGEAYAANQRK